VSGTFYPANPRILKKEIEGYLGKAPSGGLPGEIMGLVSPHAGYMYSGQTAAYGYRVIAGASFDTVIIIAPSHRSFFVGAAIDDQEIYRTPLGDIPVDTELATELVEENDFIHINSKVHSGEHSLEVQLPFLQSVLKGFSIVPIIMGTQDAESCQRLSSIIVDRIKQKKKKCLLVGSTDLSHYYPYDEAVEIDAVAVKNLNGFDVEGMIKDLAVEHYEACGAGAMIATMMVCRELGANRSRVLKYTNSGDVSGDRGSVVGYVSSVFFKES
jgi:hypothetical protein